MKYRFLLILPGLALAGCVSPDDPQAAYMPATVQQEAPSLQVDPTQQLAVQDSPVAAGSAAAFQPAGTPMAPANATGVTVSSAAAFPAPPTCPETAGTAGCPPVAPRRSNCKTVKGVTTCDVPANPYADETHYTN